MRLAGSGRLILALVTTGVIAVLKDISLMSRMVANPSMLYSSDSEVPENSLSDLHYMLDRKVRHRYSSTDHSIFGNFFLLLTPQDEDEIRASNGQTSTMDRIRVQHRGIVKITQHNDSRKWDRIQNAPRNFTFRIANETGFFVGGEYVYDRKVAVHVNETILDPTIYSKNRLCVLLQKMTHRESQLDLDPPDHGIPPAVLIVSIDCFAVKGVEEQGQYIWAMYGVKQASALAGIDVQFQCDGIRWDHLDRDSGNVEDAKFHNPQSVLPWFATHQGALARNRTWPYSDTPPSHDEVCTDREVTPWDKMAIQIRNDVRKMAVEVIGSQPEIDRRHHLVPLDRTPLIQNVSLDDVVIYFPCENNSEYGDLGSKRHDIGILHFSEYVHWISNNTDSVGIIVDQTNHDDPVEWCLPVSKALMEYLRKSFPNAEVTIYEDEPVALHFARIAMAKQSFSSMSSVGMIPVIGTFGHGYFQPSMYSGMQQRIYDLSTYEGFDNIHIMKGDVLSPEEMLTQTWSRIK